MQFLDFISFEKILHGESHPIPIVMKSNNNWILSEKEIPMPELIFFLHYHLHENEVVVWNYKLKRRIEVLELIGVLSST